MAKPLASSQAIIDAIPEGVLIVDNQGRVIQANAAYARRQGYLPEELRSMNLRDLDVSGEREAPAAFIEHLLLDGRKGILTRHRARDGATFPVAVHTTPASDGSTLVFVRDIADCETEARALDTKAARAHVFVEHATDAFFLHVEPLGAIIDVNVRACESLGYTRDELTGMTACDYDPTATPEGLREASRILSLGNSLAFNTVYRRKDGTEFPVHVRVRPFKSHDRTYAVAIARDMTDYCRTECQLTLQASIIESMSEGVIVLDDEARVAYTNGAAARFLNSNQESIFGCDIGSLAQCRIELANDTIERVHTDVLRTGHWTGDWRLIHCGGRVIQVSARLSRLEQRSMPNHVLCVVADITEQRETFSDLCELKLAHIGRLAALGEMATMVVHELRQPLAAVGNYLELLRQRLQSCDQVECGHVLDEVQAAVNDVAKLAQRVRRFVQQRNPRLSTVNLAEIIDSAVALCSIRTAHAAIRVTTQIGRRIPAMLADFVQIEQVLVNVLVNAAEAIEGRGTSDREICIRVSRFSQTHVEVRVADTGLGIPGNLRNRVFQPFFSTKPDGIGIGLSLCKQIVEAHGGVIDCLPRKPHGTVVRFTLAIHPEIRNEA